MIKENIINIGQARVDYFLEKLKLKRNRRNTEVDKDMHKHSANCGCHTGNKFRSISSRDKFLQLVESILQSGKTKEKKEEELYDAMVKDAEK